MKSALRTPGKGKKAVTGPIDPLTEGNSEPGTPQIEWNKLSVEQLRAIASDALRQLDKKAVQGDDEAVRAVVSIAARCIDILERFQGDASRAEPLISSFAFWPMLLRPKTGKKRNGKSRKQAIDAIDALGLGAGCELNVLGNYDEDAPVTRVVLRIYSLLTRTARKGRLGRVIMSTSKGENVQQQQEQWREWVNANEGKLPIRLTRANASEWADLTQPVLKIFCGEHFEHHSDFETCGKAAQILTLWRQSWNSIAGARKSPDGK